MKQKLFTAFFAFILIAGIAQAQSVTGTITDTIDVTHFSVNVESDPSNISITNAGAYQAILTITYNNTSGLTATMNSIYLKVNNVIFLASSPNIALPTATGTVKVAVALVIANTGSNSFVYSVSNGIASPSTGQVTYGPVTVDLYNDATAAATQALVTQQTADIAALTTAVTNLTNTSATQSAALTDLQTRMASLLSQISGINNNASAAQLTAIQSQLTSMRKDIKRYGVSTENPWFLANFGLDGATFGTSIYSGFNGQSAGSPSMEGSVMARPGFYEKN